MRSDEMYLAMAASFWATVPKAGASPLGANQIFVRMPRPRYRNMREVEEVLEDLVRTGDMELIVQPGRGKFRTYRMKA